jgi:hypothetical protein
VFAQGGVDHPAIEKDTRRVGDRIKRPQGLFKLIVIVVR